MSQLSQFTFQLTDLSKPTFIVPAYTTNGYVSPTSNVLDIHAIAADTPILLFGKGSPEYGKGIQESILHVLENFASPIEPLSPLEGQLWYKNDTQELFVRGVSSWNAISTTAGSFTPTSDIDMNNLYTVINLVEPTNSQDASTKAYTDAQRNTVQTNLNNHANSTSLHLTTAQNALLDGLSATLTSTELNALDDFNTGGGSVQTQINGKVSLSGSTMTGYLTLVGDPTANLHAATKLYVDSLVSGLKWLDPIHYVNLIADNVTDPSTLTPNHSDVYIVPAGAVGAWAGKPAGTIVIWDAGTSSWLEDTDDGLLSSHPAGTRFGVSVESSTAAGGTFSGKDDQIAILTNPAVPTWSFYTPASNDAMFVSNQESLHAYHQYVYDIVNIKWVEFGGGSSIQPGTNLTLVGNVLDVKDYASGGTVNAAYLQGLTPSAFATAGHTHTSANIIDFTTATQTVVGAMVSGNTENGIAVTYAAGKLNFDVNDPTVALTGDVTGSATMTNLGNISITTTVADNSHNHLSSNITDLTENVQDIVGGMVTGNTENGIAVSYDDGLGILNFDVNDPIITLIGDVTGSATMANLGNVTITTTVADGSHNHTSTDITDFTTATQTVVGAMVSGNTENGIAVTYAAGKLNFDVNDPTITLTGGVTGSAVMTNLGNVSITTSVSGSGHTHVAANITDFTTAASALVTYETLNTNGDVGTGAGQLAIGNHNHTLDSLSNTTIAANTAGEILKWSGTAWINNTLAEAGISATSHTHTGVYEPANANIQSHIANVTTNPHNVTKANVGLGNVDNTSDLNKPISTATQTALDGKSATSHNHTLDSLSNTTITANTAGEILKWSGSAWINNTLAEAGISAVGHTHTASNITDFTTAASALVTYETLNTNGDVGAGAGQLAIGNHNHTLDSLSNTTITANTAGEILKWSGSAWINNTLAEAGISATSHNHTLDSLSNTTITSNTTGEILKWSGSAWINNTLAEAGISAVGHTHVSTDITDLTEAVQDIVGGMVTGNTETNITVTYDDPTGKLNFVANAGGSSGAAYDVIIAAGGSANVTLTNVSATSKTATTSYQQVFLNGILQREDTSGFPSSGNYYVANATTLTFAFTLSANDEVLVYGV